MGLLARLQDCCGCVAGLVVMLAVVGSGFLGSTPRRQRSVIVVVVVDGACGVAVSSTSGAGVLGSRRLCRTL